MLEQLKQVIQALINDQPEQARAVIHEYIVNKTQDIVRVQEIITPMTSTEAEDSIGWHIVREKDDKCAWGPFSSSAKAKKELENHRGYATFGVAADKIVYIEHGWCDDDNEFHQQDPD